ncbi:MAG: alpha-amylase family glycosyl hydrolase, partial [Candidatus Cloacimonadaceae bacterium]|nr:alpha-amylase family glycosyl hydrolase [Candidatus Cloacimonadaceae bacterium]
NDWTIEPMHDVGGDYQISLYVHPGKYRYKYVVDGFWIADPNNPHREPDPYGGENSILTVSGPSRKLSWQELFTSSIEFPVEPYNPDHHYQDGFPKQAFPLLSVNRISEISTEFRFRWFRGLADNIILHLCHTAECGTKTSIPLEYLGCEGGMNVYNKVLSSETDRCFAIVEIRNKANSALYHSEGLSLIDYTDEGWASYEDGCDSICISLHDFPVFSIPDWVHNGVIYQIFPDRFCNGNPALDPDFSEAYYQDCRTLPLPGEVLAPHTEYFHLIKDWRDISGLVQSPYMPKGKPDWWSFYGGDIPGITQKLDYLIDLGISIIYLNPIWQAKSNHKYDSADYMKIDPHFGTEEDLHILVTKAHENGIRIILDVALNHTGETFWAFRDCLEHGPFSDYWHWYDFHKFPIPNPLPEDFDPKEY